MLCDVCDDGVAYKYVVSIRTLHFVVARCKICQKGAERVTRPSGLVVLLLAKTGPAFEWLTKGRNEELTVSIKRNEAALDEAIRKESDVGIVTRPTRLTVNR